MRSGNPLLSHLRAELKDLSKKVHFEGNAKPSIPINWRFAESISALKGLKATMIKLLVHHAPLFMSLAQVLDENRYPTSLGPLEPR
ncbi:uncharacterized protein ATNIH1004_003455 [Aspergillus tanneri]|uniref:Uncharacterized protein n=1 Tax=Aspergillus tanneri TaxID=1220188 RepID=A0A5M9MXS3_9EURO|nr:uncharacterized protein ATNIH1004_003455 [Aspergillus tanneri]KAA8650766.1 hypothetical protein ATNIH1004_003455 [Aspergillus tanneri]